jgi:hypothetical protein
LRGSSRAADPFSAPAPTDIVEAARLSRWPVADIVELLLARGLSRVEIIAAVRGFKSVRVDPEEVRQVLEARRSEGRLSVKEAADRLGFPQWGIRALTTERDRDGRPFLRATICRNGNGTELQYFEPEEIERFAAAHVDFGTIAAERGINLKAVGRMLRETGVEPILPRWKLNKQVYRRADL